MSAMTSSALWSHGRFPPHGSCSREAIWILYLRISRFRATRAHRGKKSPPSPFMVYARVSAARAGRARLQLLFAAHQQNSVQVLHQVWFSSWQPCASICCWWELICFPTRLNEKLICVITHGSTRAFGCIVLNFSEADRLCSRYATCGTAWRGLMAGLRLIKVYQLHRGEQLGQSRFHVQTPESRMLCLGGWTLWHRILTSLCLCDRVDWEVKGSRGVGKMLHLQ